MKYFDKYRAIEKIGDGGMASVYLVEDPQGNKYALKELKREHLRDSIKRKRFRIESTAIKRIDHKNVIKIFEQSHKVRVRTNSNNYYSLIYTMEYFPNNSLKELINKRRLSIQEINYIFSELFDALTYCHARRIYHRDLKPANILIRKNNNKYHPVLTDFGVAKIRNKKFTNGEALTREVTLLGAPAYMSPEQIIDPSSVDERSDLYSVGVILYEVLTGEKPFKGTRNDLISQHLNSNPIPPSKINSEIDTELENLILQLLEKRSKNRPQSALEVKSKLEHATTSSITLDPKSKRTFFYKTVATTYIAQISHGKRIKSAIFQKYPIVVGKPSRIQTINKFSIRGNTRRIESNHFEIIRSEKSSIKLRDTSRIGTIINGRKIIIDIKELSTKKVNRIRLPDGNNIEIFINIEKIINPYAVLGIIVMSVLLLIILTIILF